MAGPVNSGIDGETSEQYELFKLALDSMVCATTITDPSGTILFMSKTFADLIGQEPGDVIGKPCLSFIPTSRMHIVGKTGTPEINDLQMLNGKEVVVQRIPLRKGTKIVGVVSQVIFKEQDEIASLIRRLRAMKKKVQMYEETVASYNQTRYGMDHFIATSPFAVNLKKKARRLAVTDLSILIMGENGTGKEILAQAIHSCSARSAGPFVRINCANIPKDLFESELFGYVHGAFTGARTDGYMGKLEMANNGTLFLDEIGELPFDMQAKLLNVLEDKAFYRVGGNSLIHVNFRIIAATNQNLTQNIQRNTFRKDLFYRLGTACLVIKPLRERPEDVIAIADDYLRNTAKSITGHECHLTTEAKQRLMGYEWPGNVRELINCLESSLALCEKPEIDADDLMFPGLVDMEHAQDPFMPAESNFQIRKQNIERESILSALQACDWCKSAAAKLLGIHRSLLYRKIEVLGLEQMPEFKKKKRAGARSGTGVGPFDEDAEDPIHDGSATAIPSD